MNHIFQKGTNKNTFVLLHGTGGNEHDLVPLAKYIDPEANVLGIRGNINENGMNRFFKRFGMGKYDLDSISIEATKLYDFILLSSKKYGFDFNNVYLLGFSNGANIAIAMMQRFDMHISGAYLLSPVYIEPNRKFGDLSTINITITASNNDPYATDEEILKLAEDIDGQSKSLNVLKHSFGHTVNQIILDEVKNDYLNTQTL